MKDYARVHRWWPARQLGDLPIAQLPSELELRNALDAAWHLSRAYRNGFIQKESLDDRRRWAIDAANLLQLLATALNERLPNEGSSPQLDRMAKVNLRFREIEAEEARTKGQPKP